MNTTDINAFGIVLKPLKEEYLPFLVDWRNDPKVIVNMDDRRKVNLKVMHTWFNINQNKQDTIAYVAFVNDKPFAYVAFSKIGLKENVAEGGMFFNPEMINSGIFANVFLAREIILKNINTSIIFSVVRNINKRGIKIQEAFGAVLDRKDEAFNYYFLYKKNRAPVLEKYADILGYKEDFDCLLRNWLYGNQ